MGPRTPEIPSTSLNREALKHMISLSLRFKLTQKLHKKVCKCVYTYVYMHIHIYIYICACMYVYDTVYHLSKHLQELHQMIQNVEQVLHARSQDLPAGSIYSLAWRIQICTQREPNPSPRPENEESMFVC